MDHLICRSMVKLDKYVFWNTLFILSVWSNHLRRTLVSCLLYTPHAFSKIYFWTFSGQYGHYLVISIYLLLIYPSSSLPSIKILRIHSLLVTKPLYLFCLFVIDNITILSVQFLIQYNSPDTSRCPRIFLYSSGFPSLTF